jgi:hypothetical protein
MTISKTVFAVACGLALSANAVSARSFLAENRVPVVSTGGSSFVVQGNGGWGAQGSWCAAADYARTVLGAVSSQQIYVDNQPRLPKRHTKFTLSQAGLPDANVLSLSATLRTPGTSVSVGGGHQYCRDIRETHFD